MKKFNNNLIRIINSEIGETKYFTKETYVMNYIGCSQAAMPKIRTNKSRDYAYINYEIVDGSEIKWKDINIL